jgi:hypothetical protein
MKALRWIDVPSLYCACGAQWHGQHAQRERNPVIEGHESRRYDYRCRLISQTEYEQRYARIRGRTRGRKSFGGVPPR